MAPTLKLSYCYSHEDKEMREKLARHLSSLERQKLIETWHDREISPGAEWKEEVEKHLKTSNIILLLISANFIASEYCYGREMKLALEKHDKGEACVIPILIQPVYWKEEPFSKLQMLPTDALPISLWTNVDAAFTDIVAGIHRAIKTIATHLVLDEQDMNASPSLEPKEEREKPFTRKMALQELEHAILLDPENAQLYYKKGELLLALQLYEEALLAYDQAISLEANNTEFYHTKGKLLKSLRRTDEALQVYNQAISLNISDKRIYQAKGNLLHRLKRYEEALQAYDQVICCDPGNPTAYYAKGIIFRFLKRYEEALQAYDQAIRYDASDAKVYQAKGSLLQSLKRYDEAIQAYDQAISLDNENAQVHYNKGEVLRFLKRYPEALQAYEQTIRINPDKVSAHYFRGIVLGKLNNRKQSFNAYFKAFKLGQKY